MLVNTDESAGVELSSLGFLSADRVSWSPDGAEILVARSDTLWAVNVSTDVARVVAAPELERLSAARWSPDGSRISFTAHSTGTAPSRGLFVMDANGSRRRQLAGSFEVSGASWSPAGAQVVYAASSDGTTYDVFVTASDGTEEEPKKLTRNAHGVASLAPDWARTR